MKGKVTEEWRKIFMTFIICTLHQILLGCLNHGGWYGLNKQYASEG